MPSVAMPVPGKDVPRSRFNLGAAWFCLEGLAERGAAGRLVVAQSKLSRADLAYNWEVVAAAILHFGTRPGVDSLKAPVEEFFNFARPRGKRPVTDDLAMKPD